MHSMRTEVKRGAERRQWQGHEMFDIKRRNILHVLIM